MKHTSGPVIKTVVMEKWKYSIKISQKPKLNAVDNRNENLSENTKLRHGELKHTKQMRTKQLCITFYSRTQAHLILPLTAHCTVHSVP